MKKRKVEKKIKLCSICKIAGHTKRNCSQGKINNSVWEKIYTRTLPEEFYYDAHLDTEGNWYYITARGALRIITKLKYIDEKFKSEVIYTTSQVIIGMTAYNNALIVHERLSSGFHLVFSLDGAYRTTLHTIELFHRPLILTENYLISSLSPNVICIIRGAMKFEEIPLPSMMQNLSCCIKDINEFTIICATKLVGDSILWIVDFKQSSKATITPLSNDQRLLWVNCLMFDNNRNIIAYSRLTSWVFFINRKSGQIFDAFKFNLVEPRSDNLFYDFSNDSIVLQYKSSDKEICEGYVRQKNTDYLKEAFLSLVSSYSTYNNFNVTISGKLCTLNREIVSCRAKNLLNL